LTTSTLPALCVMGLETAMLMVTSTAAVGMASLDQLLAVSQSPPFGLIHGKRVSLTPLQPTILMNP
jgi:hypothetical protein